MIEYKIDSFHMYEFSVKNPRAVIFFAHANGIPAVTYKDLWTLVSETLNVSILCYDMRGIGKTTSSPVYNDQNWGWKVLVDDHVKLFERVKKTYPKNTQFILCGHSVGAWISLLSTQHVGEYPLLLCDPPILRGKEAIGWLILHLLKKRTENQRSKKALNRRINFDSEESALEFFSKTPLLSKWDKSILTEYIRGLFQHDSHSNQFVLKHSPEWEAHIFAQYPPTATQGFKQLPKKLRDKLKPIFLVGELSDACDPKAKGWIKRFFPHLQWVVIPKVGHMFPIENRDAMLTALESVLKIP